MPRTRTQMAFETRHRLLNSAAKLFAERGFDGASVEDIATHAGYTHGAIYKHFSGKEDLFLEAFRNFLSPRITSLLERVQALDKVEDQIAVLAEAFMDRMENDRDWVLLENEFWLFAMRRPHLRERISQMYANLRHFYAVFDLPGWRRRARRIDARSEDLIAVVSALLDGLARQHYAAPTKVDGDFVQMSLRALLGMRRSIPEHLALTPTDSAEK